MEAQLSDIKMVKLDGVENAAWKIMPVDQKTVNGELYVRIQVKSQSLMHLVKPHASSKAWLSMSTSKGLKALIASRNNVQQSYAHDQAGQAPAALMDDEGKSNQKAPRRSRYEIESAYKESESMNLDVEGQQIKVLKSVNPKDALYVLYNADDLGVVLNFLRDQGFDDSLCTSRIQHDGDQGIQKRGNGFTVLNKYTGKRSYAKSFEEALSMQQRHADEQEIKEQVAAGGGGQNQADHADQGDGEFASADHAGHVDADQPDSELEVSDNGSLISVQEGEA